MNAILKGYLNDFIKNFELDFNQKEGVLFEQYVNNLIITNEGLNDFDFRDFSVGGSDDLGIDGIAIVLNDNELITDLERANEICANRFNTKFIFIQSKAKDVFDSGEFLKFIEGVKDFFKDNEPKYINDKVRELFDIKTAIYDNSIRFKNNPNIYLAFAFTGIKGEDRREYVKKAKNELKNLSLFNEIYIDVLDAKDLQDIQKDIDLNIEREIVLEDIVTLKPIEKIQESYIGLIAFEELLKLILDNNKNLNRNLFYENIRDFQPKSKINEEIKNTMINPSDSDYFVLYHNGITIVARSLNKTGQKINMNSFQIINGCQTCNILARNYKNIKNINKMSLPLKLIATDDNETIIKIIKSTNKSNEVKDEAFESLGKYHKELEEFFSAKNKNMNDENKVYYERRSKQYQFDNIAKNQIITLGSCVRAYLGMFYREPHSVHRYYGELLNAYREKYRLFQKSKNSGLELYHIAALLDKKIYKYLSLKKENFNFRPHLLMLFKEKNAPKLHIDSPKFFLEKDCASLYEIILNENKLQKELDSLYDILISTIKENNNKYNLDKKKFFTYALLDKLNMK